jgi:hypothetical protein
MAFWSTPKNGEEPKRGFRFQLLNGNIPAYTIKKVSKPSFTVNESTHKYLNHTFYYPGSVEWETVSFTLVDPVNPDAAATLANIIREGGYAPMTGPGNTLETTSKSKAMAALGEIKIQQLNAAGEKIETWTLKNAWIKNVNFGELDYESEDLTEVQVEIRYDYASLETANSGTDMTPGGGSALTTKKFWDAGQK